MDNSNGSKVVRTIHAGQNETVEVYYYLTDKTCHIERYSCPPMETINRRRQEEKEQEQRRINEANKYIDGVTT